MNERLESIRRRWAAATPGPWVWDGDPVRPETLWSPTAEIMIFEAIDSYNNASMRWPNMNRIHDQSAIAMAPEDIAWLLAEVDRLHIQLADIEDWARESRS